MCEVPQRLEDKAFKTSYDLRWLFIHSSQSAATAERRREKALKDAQAALDRLSKLMGKYQYRKRQVITCRIEEELLRADALARYPYSSSGVIPRVVQRLTR